MFGCSALRQGSEHRNFTGLTLGIRIWKPQPGYWNQPGKYRDFVPSLTLTFSMVKAVGYTLYLLVSWCFRGYKTSRPVEERKEADSIFGFESLRLDLWHHKINNTDKSSPALLPLWWVLLEVPEDRKTWSEWRRKAQQWIKQLPYHNFQPSRAPEQQIWHLSVSTCTCTWSMPVQLLQCVQSLCVHSRELGCLLWCLSLWTPGMHRKLVWYGVDFCMVGGCLSEISRCCLEIWWNTAQSSWVRRLEKSFTCVIDVVCI